MSLPGQLSRHDAALLQHLRVMSECREYSKTARQSKGADGMSDSVRSGIVVQTHAGGHNYGFRLIDDEQWYVIPLDGSISGAAVQAMKVELAKVQMVSISFLADDARVIQFHGNNGYWAHDFD
jgi:hypothetical protein